LTASSPCTKSLVVGTAEAVELFLVTIVAILNSCSYHFTLCDQYRADSFEGLASWALCRA
jgi:hypothetical protein